MKYFFQTIVRDFLKRTTDKPGGVYGSRGKKERVRALLFNKGSLPFADVLVRFVSSALYPSRLRRIY